MSLQLILLHFYYASPDLRQNVHPSFRASTQSEQSKRRRNRHTDFDFVINGTVCCDCCFFLSCRESSANVRSHTHVLLIFVVVLLCSCVAARDLRHFMNVSRIYVEKCNRFPAWSFVHGHAPLILVQH